MLDYMYGAGITITNENFPGILHTASYLQIDSLLRSIATFFGAFIGEKMNCENCLDFYAFIDVYNLDMYLPDKSESLSKFTLDYMKNNLKSILENDHDVICSQKKYSCIISRVMVSKKIRRKLIFTIRFVSGCHMNHS